MCNKTVVLQECDNHVPLIDITEEVQQLANFQQAGGMSTMELYRIVTDPKGTTDSLKAVMLQWIQLHKAHSASQLESNASEDLPAACAETENVQPGQSPSVSTATAAQAGSNQCQTRSASPSAHHLMHQIVGFSVSST